jgi:hypothetical protein
MISVKINQRFPKRLQHDSKKEHPNQADEIPAFSH